MKIDIVSFGNKFENTQNGDVKYSKEYSDDGQLLSKKAWQTSTNKPLKIERYDSNGDVFEIQEFSYSHNKTVEHYKNNNQEYTRTITKEINDGVNHIKEVFISKTTPKNNYITETLRDMAGKMVQIIHNGKPLL